MIDPSTLFDNPDMPEPEQAFFTHVHDADDGTPLFGIGVIFEDKSYKVLYYNVETAMKMLQEIHDKVNHAAQCQGELN